MVWKKVPAGDIGASDIFGGDDMNKVSDGFAGVDVDDFDINSDFSVRSGKRKLRNSANTFDYIEMGSAIAANRTVTEPLLTANDTRVYEAHIQTLLGKTLTTPIINGSKWADPSTKTSNYTLTATDSIIRADASAAPITLTLPAASGNTGLTYTIIRKDAAMSTNALTIDPNASELIDNNLNYRLWTGESVVIECDGTGWNLISAPQPNLANYYILRGTTFSRRFIAGVNGSNVSPITSTTGPTVNTLYAMPFIVSRTTKFDTIEAEVTTLGSGSNLRLGIYHDDGNCYPGALRFDSGNISAATTGVKAATITAALQIFSPGLYWLTYENSATVPQIRANPASECIAFGGYGSPVSTGNGGQAWSVPHTVGALPDPYTAGAALRTSASTVSSPIPAVAMRAV